jgi:hypothetical protein
MAKKKIALPEDNEIISKKDSFSNFVDDVVAGKTDIIKTNSAQHKLELIKDELLSLKDKGLAFKTITLMIKEHFDLKINEQTVRKYCQDVLGFEKKRKIKTKKIDNKNTTSIKKPTSEDKNKIKSDVMNGLTSDEEFD